jgi:hypothetical protein
MLSVVMVSVVMLSVIMLSVVMLSVIMLSVVMQSVIMQGVVMLNVVMLSVVAPPWGYLFWLKKIVSEFFIFFYFETRIFVIFLLSPVSDIIKLFLFVIYDSAK